MDAKLVTELSSDSTGAADNKAASPPFRYSDMFDEYCGYYLSVGMSFEDYWDGDSTMVKYYRKKDELENNRMNFKLWLQGAYIYEALLCVCPAYDSFSKHRTPQPYREQPIPLTDKEADRQREEKERKLMEENRKAMEEAMIRVNKRFKSKKEGGQKNDGD